MTQIFVIEPSVSALCTLVLQGYVQLSAFRTRLTILSSYQRHFRSVEQHLANSYRL